MKDTSSVRQRRPDAVVVTFSCQCGSSFRSEHVDLAAMRQWYGILPEGWTHNTDFVTKMDWPYLCPSCNPRWPRERRNF